MPTPERVTDLEYVFERRSAKPAAVRGGRRVTDPPLTTRDCADWMGVTTEFIRGAIADGELRAEDVKVHGRRLIRIYVDDFTAYLQKIHWKRIPTRR